MHDTGETTYPVTVLHVHPALTPATAVEPLSCRGTKMPKHRKVGRPILPKGEAKAKIMPVRINPDDRKRIQKAAKDSMQTVSQWVRSTLMAALEV